jgi:cytochrome bd-type quinol oxidase subunit 1
MDLMDPILSLPSLQQQVALAQGFDPTSDFRFPGGIRTFTGLTMLAHMVFAQIFVGFAIAAPVLQAWGARTGSPRMDRLAHSMVKFNVLTFSTGATFAVLFMVLMVGFYPRLIAALFTQFSYIWFIAIASILISLWGMYTYYYKWDRYSVLNKGRHALFGFAMGAFIWIWMVLMSGIDSYMTTGGGQNAAQLGGGGALAPVQAIFNPMFVEEILHRTFANLSWPAFALAAWASLKYFQAKKPSDKSYYDWATSVGLTWGVGFLLLQPIGGFFLMYSLKDGYRTGGEAQTNPYERMTSGEYFTSGLLKAALIMTVVLFILSSFAMYIGAGRHPDRGGRIPIRTFGLVAAVAGLYAISPLAGFPFLYMRYIALLIMVLATFGALLAYVRGRLRFRYGSPGPIYRIALLTLGVVAMSTALTMGWMKSNSRVPYTVYNEPEFRVEGEQPPRGFGQ